MNSVAKAFAPANISCIFKIYEHRNPRWKGSYGVGFTLNEGVIVTATKSRKAGIFFNNKIVKFPTVRTVIKKLTGKKIRLSIKSKLPLGCGFGLSGASALAAAYAVNKLLNLKKSRKELAIVAHISEVENNSGLGDVVNQYYGGLCLKFRPSSHFSVKKIPAKNTNIYCRYFNKMSTKSVITNPILKNKIKKSAHISLNKIRKLLNRSKKAKINGIIKISKEFSIKSGLLKDKKIMKIIKNIENRNGNASMIMLGNAIFSDIYFRGSKKFTIKNKGAHLL